MYFIRTYNTTIDTWDVDGERVTVPLSQWYGPLKHYQDVLEFLKTNPAHEVIEIE